MTYIVAQRASDLPHNGYEVHIAASAEQAADIAISCGAVEAEIPGECVAVLCPDGTIEEIETEWTEEAGIKL